MNKRRNNFNQTSHARKNGKSRGYYCACTQYCGVRKGGCGVSWQLGAGAAELAHPVFSKKLFSAGLGWTMPTQFSVDATAPDMYKNSRKELGPMLNSVVCS